MVQKSTSLSISSSYTKVPWTRRDLGESLFNSNISPRPNNFSAPTVSKITRESTWDATAKATRAGIFAFNNPVTTFTEGRWVANTKWIPVARPNCANLTKFCSISNPPTIIKSANSSTINTKYGIFSLDLAL